MLACQPHDYCFDRPRPHRYEPAEPGRVPPLVFRTSGAPPAAPNKKWKAPTTEDHDYCFDRPRPSFACPSDKKPSGQARYEPAEPARPPPLVFRTSGAPPAAACSSNKHKKWKASTTEDLSPPRRRGGPRTIHRAVIRGDLAAALAFLRADPRASSARAGPDGLTPLHLAAIKGDECMVSAFLAARAPPALGDFGGNTPLDYAIDNQRLGVAEALLATGGVPAAGPVPPLYRAALLGAAPFVSLLLEKKAAPGEATRCRRSTPLMAAAREGHLDVIRLLLGAGAPVDATDALGSSALALAARHGQGAAAALLLGAGAAHDLAAAGGVAPLHSAALEGHLGATRVLLEAGADPVAASADGSTPLYYAAAYGHAEVARCLLEEAPAGRGALADPAVLATAALYGHPRVVALLLEKGARADSCHEGLYPASYALAAGDAASFKMLVAPFLVGGHPYDLRKALAEKALILHRLELEEKGGPEPPRL